MISVALAALVIQISYNNNNNNNNNNVVIPADRNIVLKEAEKKLKYKRFYIDTTNVEPEMYDYTSNN